MLPTHDPLSKVSEGCPRQTFGESVDKNNIHDLAMNLHSQGVNLEQEDDAAGFLGVTLGRDE